MLVGKGISKRFGGLEALSRLDFEVKEGEVVGLIGPNGSGKTTLFNVISGFYRPNEGILTFKGERIDGRRPYEIAKMGIGRTFQIVKPLLAMTVLENVAVGVLYGRQGEMDMKRALEKSEEIIHFSGLEKKIHVRAANLAMVDRKRLEIARAMATRPEILLLDESDHENLQKNHRYPPGNENRRGNSSGSGGESASHRGLSGKCSGYLT